MKIKKNNQFSYQLIYKNIKKIFYKTCKINKINSNNNLKRYIIILIIKNNLIKMTQNFKINQAIY